MAILKTANQFQAPALHELFASYITTSPTPSIKLKLSVSQEQPKYYSVVQVTDAMSLSRISGTQATLSASLCHFMRLVSVEDKINVRFMTRNASSALATSWIL